MPQPNPDVIRAIEAQLDLMVHGFQHVDISSLSDLVTDTTLLMPPERRTARGEAVLERWRNMAQAIEGFKLLSTDMRALGDAHVSDAGTMSFRLRQNGNQSIMRYLMVWQHEGTDWKLASMIWNRERDAGPGRGD